MSHFPFIFLSQPELLLPRSNFKLSSLSSSGYKVLLVMKFIIAIQSWSHNCLRSWFWIAKNWFPWGQPPVIKRTLAEYSGMTACIRPAMGHCIKGIPLIPAPGVARTTSTTTNGSSPITIAESHHRDGRRPNAKLGMCMRPCDPRMDRLSWAYSFLIRGIEQPTYNASRIGLYDPDLTTGKLWNWRPNWTLELNHPHTIFNSAGSIPMVHSSS